MTKAKKEPNDADQERVSPDNLYLDVRNPRIDVPANATQKDILKYLWTNAALDELALSIANNGYFSQEPLLVIVEQNKHVVVEGNRRIATVKLLRSPELRQELRATDLPKASASVLRETDKLDVLIYPDRKSVWAYIGFRHVNGPLTWDSWSKAQYIARVHNEHKIPLDEIAKRIGDKHQTVVRLYRGLMVLNQAVDQAGYDVDDRSRAHLAFSHLYTGLDYSGFQKHLGLTKDAGYKENPVPKKNLEHLKELMTWLFGSKTDSKLPVVRSQNPDLKRLDAVLTESRALHALRSGLGLEVSHQLSFNEDIRFRETLVKIRYDLQQAKGLVLDGYAGDSDLLQTAQAIKELAAALCDEMDTIAHRSPPKRRKS